MKIEIPVVVFLDIGDTMFETSGQICSLSGIDGSLLDVVFALVHVILDTDEAILEFFEFSFANLSASREAEGALADIFEVLVYPAFQLRTEAEFFGRDFLE